MKVYHSVEEHKHKDWKQALIHSWLILSMQNDPFHFCHYHYYHYIYYDCYRHHNCYHYSLRNNYNDIQYINSALFPEICVLQNDFHFCLQWRITMLTTSQTCSPLRCRHNGRDGVSNHQSHDCLLNRLFMRRLKKPPKLRVTGLFARNSPMTGEFPAKRASNTENVSIWWCHHDQSG